MEILKKNSPDNFLSQSDVEDFEDHVIEQSMCLGNLLARRNCLVEGSFGKIVHFKKAVTKLAKTVHRK